MTIKREDLDRREVEPHAALDATARLMGDIHPANPTCRLAAHTVL